VSSRLTLTRSLFAKAGLLKQAANKYRLHPLAHRTLELTSPVPAHDPITHTCILLPLHCFAA
jgi:hypothetical protein